MALCQYYLRGRCKYGDRCRNEHPSSSGNLRGNQMTSSNNQIAIPFTVETIVVDITPNKDKPLWPLSSYGPAKYEPVVIGGLDESPEELRLKAVTALTAGTAAKYTKYEGGRIMAAEQMFANARKNVRQVYEQARKASIQNQATGSITFVSTQSAFGTSTTPFAFGAATSAPVKSAFGQPVFGQTGFGSTGSGTSTFGQLDPSSPSGYERKFETMLSEMSESRNPEIREQSRHYVRPEQIKEAVRTAIKNVIRDSPLVLINTLSGCLCNKSEQAAVFESTPAFVTLITSMTTHIDHALIEQVVGEFYRYAMFSHTWEGNEPLYEKVIKIVVYDLEVSPPHEKLKMFCKLVRDEGYNWAWSDTCCIDQKDPTVLQESLVSMFRWYEESVMTIIFLYDVDRLAEIGALMKSKWNSRGWTLQEYHASKVVRIYTKDWLPYLGLTIYNHKESPEIILEMEKATGISARALMALRPGLNDIREKLRLASTRQTTRFEDAAYSLLGIFSMTLPITYGEGDKALGRLLSQLLTSSGDTSILAWTGKSGSFNSCLPTDIVVFSQSVASHIPPSIPSVEMATIIAGLRASEPDVNLVARLCDHLHALPVPSFAVQRMKLPCLAFKIRLTSYHYDGSEFVFRAQAGALGIVEVKTRQNISGLEPLYLVHPWIDFLLDRHALSNIVETAPGEDEAYGLDEFPSFYSFPDHSSTSRADPVDDAESPPSPTASLMEAQTEFLARLRQPFGALLLAPTRRNMAEYKRIATESLITVQVQEVTSATLNRLIQGVRVLDVL